MDPVSHVVFGYCIVRAGHIRAARGAERANRGVGLAITLGALSPDIDLIIMPTGWDRYLAVHEIGTHSIIGAVVCGVLAAGLARMIRRQSSYRALVVPAVAAAVSHVFADLLSGASIRIAWPLLDTRVANVGVIAMADPVMIVATSIGAIALVLWRTRRTLIAITWLASFMLFTLPMTILRERAELAYREDPAYAEAVGEYLVEPVWGSWMHWRIFDRTSSSVRGWIVAPSGRVERTIEMPRRTGEDDLIEGSMAWDTVRNFHRAHDLTFAIATATGVEWSDVRYCSSGGTGSRPRCGVWVGGEFSTAPNLGRLIVRVGDVVQVR